MQLFYAELKTTQRKYRDGFPSGLGLRTHRSLSWLQRAEQEQGDDDARFIFLWIAFNAAYAHEISIRLDKVKHATGGFHLCRVNMPTEPIRSRHYL